MVSKGPARVFCLGNEGPAGDRRDPQKPAISIFLRKNRTCRDPTRVPPGPTRVHPIPIFLGPGPILRLGSKNLIHSDVGPMYGLFDHGPVFSAAVQIIFQAGWAIACGMEARYLPNERKTAWTRRTAPVGTTANCRSHRNVTDTGRLQATRTSRNYCDKKSCRCF